MPRYLVTTHRDVRDSAESALGAVTGQPGITIVNAHDPHMVTIEASDEAARQLQSNLKDTHFVELEIHRGLH
jgi:hypothetical protein